MSLAINTAVPSTIENAGMDLRSAALNQAATATDATTSPVTLTAVDPQVASARLAKYIHATDTNFHTGEDAKNVANAQFDFHLDNGSIQVTSGSLSDSDKTWLQNLLNGNSALVQAANTFRRDAVGGYSERAEADGNPVTKAQSDALGQQVDQTTNFMQLFQQISAKGAKFVSTGGGTLYASNGAKMDFSQSPGNAVGFLAFMQSTAALDAGKRRGQIRGIKWPCELRRIQGRYVCPEHGAGFLSVPDDVDRGARNGVTLPRLSRMN